MVAQVKICGLNTAASVAASIAGGADYLGFVFFPPSPRAVTAQEAASLAAPIAQPLRKVGLFVNPRDGEIEAVLSELPLDIIQLHDVPVARALQLRERLALPVWRSVGIATADDLPRDSGGVDALLLDAKPRPDAALPGGNGQAFDWSILADFAPSFAWILAGGLTPDTVADAVRRTGAPIVDVSSGVEQSRGCKDPALIRSFLSAVRNA
ncbi:N-(5'-phosphoribosyl)anthranilate isomerase [Granulibacter bethesdensis]|uniref:N-(5'-phosphoribosyl)anthranilate isomerase n=1 Tax=Granulibacter bethesdensis TaxID=364410 RepID=A0AAC9KDC2_9PROT|nr:phosphoribosylanthranilate isomerase [Granulibacter bethesdensis]APH55333.1 N-(5'-phosphoribosyl)anthranilate isomerase [Granulibacter bethesdensis]APH62920.1 N-(5'-phosphoribosyl)anthranilate isomerase [Granulibacter bethesdensis]